MKLQLDLIIGMLINIIIMFFLVKKFLIKGVVKTLQTRKALIEKLESADEQYESMITKAKEEADDIIAKGVQHKDKILTDAKVLADKTKDEIIENGRKEADKIAKNAEHKAKLLEEELANNFADSVKSTTEVVVKKLVNKDVDIKAAYLDTLVEEATK